MLRQLRTLLVSIFILAAGSFVFAQDAQVQGQVTDSSGATIPRALVRVVDQRTGAERRTETDSSGEYSVPALNPSIYKMLVQAPGFSISVSNAIILNVAQNAVINFKLEVGGTSSRVVVNAGDLSVNTTDATVSTVIDRQFVENIPLNGRTFQSLIGATPGVVATPTPVAGEQGQFSVAGQRAGSNYFSIDGVSANFAAAVAQYQAQAGNGGLPAFSGLGTTASLVSLDALQEFRIESSTYAPEFGRSNGAQIVLATRSGTNAFHGTAFDYLRNDAFDSTDWFADNTGQPKPRERQNDFGGVLGGPIRKDKSFFFFSYEGLRVTQPLFQISDVPSLAARSSAASNLNAIVDLFPLPNGPETDTDLAQLAASTPNHGDLDAASLRLDQVVNSKLTLFGRIDHAPSSVDVVYSGFPASNPFKTEVNIDTGTVGAIALLAPTVTDDFRFNYSRAHAEQHTGFDNFGGAVPPPSSAIWSPVQDQNTGNVVLALGTGRNTTFDAGTYGNNVNRQFNVTDSASVAWGKHSMKFGFDFRRLTPTQGPPSSWLIYEWLVAPSLVNGDVPDIIEMWQDQSNIRQIYHNFSSFAQDTWKLSPRLTLTYGIRWDYNPPPSEANGAANAPYTLSEITDLSTATLLPRGSPLWHADWKNFAPRLGLAYQFAPNKERPLVLRAGFGQFYDLGTDTAPFVDNSEGWFPYSIASVLCEFGEGPYCSNTVPYTGPKPPFVFDDTTQNSMRAFDPNLKLPYSLEWNVALEQTISPNQTFTVAYVGSVDHRLLRDDVTANPNPATSDLFSTIYVTKNSAYANYNALQLKYQRRLLHGFQALFSYSWSHSLDINSSDVTYENPGLPSTLYNVRQDYGNSDFDIRQTFSAALTYDIPYPKIQNRLAKATLENWSINSNNTFRTGAPFNVFYSPETPGEFTNGSGSAFEFRPNQVAGQPVWISDKAVPGGRELNAAAFTVPSTLEQGSEPRNNISGFSLVEMDIGLRRQFDISERVNLQFRAEGFNVINHPNFGNPLNTLGTCALGVPCTPEVGFGTSQAMLNQSMGSSNFHGTPLNALYQVGGPRSLQLSMKLQF